MVKLTQKQQKYLNHFDAEPPGDYLTLISWSFIEYSDCITSGSKGPCVILGRKKKCFSSCNSMGVIPDEPEFFSSLLKLQQPAGIMALYDFQVTSQVKFISSQIVHGDIWKLFLT